MGAVRYAIGQNNFLFDPTQTPRLTGYQLAELVGAANSTLAAKAKEVRQLVRMRQGIDPDYVRPTLLPDFPGVWLLAVDGVLVDARSLPPAIQDELHRRKLIPDPAVLRR